LDHGGGEYSLYCHLSRVSKSPHERVRQGDVIALVGNTGHSTEPHLHFQLMDGPDFLTAHGLPIMFDDAPMPDGANALQTRDGVHVPSL
jgi:murein DD-endopeptidase MepM/ murein hydrolase activator NlpD